MRTATKHRNAALALLAGLGWANAPVVGAAMLNFDDILPATSDQPVPVGYGGFDWESSPFIPATMQNADYMDATTGFGNSYGAPSGTTAIYTNAELIIKRAEDFTFNNVYLTSFSGFDAAYGSSAGGVQVRGFNNGVEVGSQSVVLANDKYSPFDFSTFGVVDELRFLPTAGLNSGLYFLLDNLSYDIQPAAVPLPGAVWLLGGALAGLMGSARRRRAGR
ncbi:MAG: hypothetical protein NFCOHLIN_00057 [Gammaproteobacteria bacterium]|nr:hypothetical protein [Gammaproteobacteria bacterium]